jgi:hypothetical protein
MNHIDELPSAWKGHRGFAQWLVQYLQPKITVELGVDNGYSCFCLAENNSGQVFGIDTFEGDVHAGTRDQGLYQQVLDFKTVHKFDNVQLVKNTFDAACALWFSPIDLLHLDGLHTAQAVTHDIVNWSKFFHENTVLLMHDVVSFPEVEQVFLNIPQPKIRFLHSGGLGVLCQNPDTIEYIKSHWAKDVFYEHELLPSNPEYDQVKKRYLDDSNTRYSTS